MAKTLPFSEAIEMSATGGRHLLLGNGFSIALFPAIFSYSSLLDTADFSKKPYLKTLFQKLDTSDFEYVIRSLNTAAVIATVYGGSQSAMLEDAAFLKELLVTTIASNHPALPSEVDDRQYAHARAFLANFSHKFTLNYDLLLYWALMRREVDDLDLTPDDGFRDPGYSADYVVWDSYNTATVHYPHGALHLFDDATELQKYTWARTNIPLMDQIRSALERNAFPLFVAEGKYLEKLDKINHNAYLHKALRSFMSCAGSLFVFGHSMSGDEHIFSELSKGRSKYRSLFVSIYGDPDSPSNISIVNKVIDIAKKRPEKRPLDVFFYDSASAKVWG